ncbi:MAG: helix-turn-helix transcriptional regulator [Bacteroidetes bacterium]|nr:helix-turn-helix transcriptional regulator [Bacteroidota bacterium]
MPKIPQKILARQMEITADFQREVDRHLDDILAGRTTDMYEIHHLAAILHIHPTHLSNTVKLITGHSPCHYFEQRIMDVSRDLLANSDESIAGIAMRLTYDPSNFTKFFKKFEGVTPKQYREHIRLAKAETVTI